MKSSYDVVIVGGGGHGLAAAYYLAANHGITGVAVLEKGLATGPPPAGPHRRLAADDAVAGGGEPGGGRRLRGGRDGRDHAAGPFLDARPAARYPILGALRDPPGAIIGHDAVAGAKPSSEMRLSPRPGQVINRAEPLDFARNGRPVRGYRGDTIVPALAAAGGAGVLPGA
jgi:hypothetical protein